jgi:hypothetical protein
VVEVKREERKDPPSAPVVEVKREERKDLPSAPVVEVKREERKDPPSAPVLETKRAEEKATLALPSRQEPLVAKEPETPAKSAPITPASTKHDPPARKPEKPAARLEPIVEPEKSIIRLDPIVDDALLAQDQHSKLTDPIDQHDWMANSLARSQGAIGARLGEGLAFLATVGSTAPFSGLFGTVSGIYRALIKIGASGQASISTVAGPVGEALIMTALGLVVAVPAVLAYNWLIRRNKSISEDLAAFTNDVHGYIMSGGAVKPIMASPKQPAQVAKPAPTAAR